MGINIASNERGFMTNMCEEILKRAGKDVSETDDGVRISAGSSSADFWSCYGDCITDDKTVKLSVEDDLTRIDMEYARCQFGRTCDKYYTRYNTETASGEMRENDFGVFNLMTALSPSTILDSLISVGERRSSLYKDICKSEGSTRIISAPPVETDLRWLFHTWKATRSIRWVAFPWNNAIKVLMVGNHKKGNSCFPEGMVSQWGGGGYPLHMIECYNRDMCWQHSDIQAYSAFVVDCIDNVPDVISFIDGCELAASYLDEIYDTEYDTVYHTTKEKLSRCLGGDGDIYVTLLKRAIKDFISTYRALLKHPICTDKAILNWMLRSFAVDVDTAKTITGMPLKELREFSK